jgi:hypothetical protein
MKGPVRVLICDGTPLRSGLIIKPEGVEFRADEVGVTLEDRPFDIAAYVGTAKFRLDNGTLWADLNLLDFKLPEPARMVLYPVPEILATEWKGQVVTKCYITRLSLSIETSPDTRVDTIGNQGIKP